MLEGIHVPRHAYCSFISSSQKYLNLQGKGTAGNVQGVERITKSDKRALTLKNLLMAGFLFILPCAVATKILLFHINEVLYFKQTLPKAQRTQGIESLT